MIKRVAFVELEEEANAFIGRYLDRGGGPEFSGIVALSKASQLPFRNRDIPYLDSFPFFDNEAHRRALDKSEEWLRLLESRLDPGNILYKELVFHLRFVLSHLLWMTEVLAGVLDKLKPALVYGPQGKAFFGPSQALTAGDRFLGALLARMAQKDHFEIEFFKTPDSPGPHPKPPRQTGGGLQAPGRSPFFYRLVEKNFRILAGKRSCVLLASPEYGMGRAAGDPDTVPKEWTRFLLDFQTVPGEGKESLKIPFRLLKNWFKSFSRRSIISLPVRFFPADGPAVDALKGELEKTAHFLLDRLEGQWRRVFSHRGVDLAPLVSGKLREGIFPYLAGLAEDGHRLKSLLEAVRPAAVLSPFSVGPSSVLGDLCQALNIPAVLIPHGSLLPPKNRWEEIEWRRLSQAQMLSAYPYTVAQTPLAARHAAFFEISHKTWNTGPILFPKPGGKNGSGRRKVLDLPEGVPVIVYAVAQRKRSSVRFYIFETEDENFSSMADVVRAVNGMEKAHLIIKLHPSAEFSEGSMRQLLPPSDRMSILRDVPFSDVLAASDLLVSYTSTVIEEAIQNRIPVVLFDKWKRFSFFDALDCSETAPEHWRAGVGYYVHDPGLLPPVFSFALSHAREAAGSDSLYGPFCFGEGERKPLSFFLEKLTRPGSGERRKP